MSMISKNETRSESKPKIKSNVFIDTVDVIAREGIHTATVVKTMHVGKTMTKHGLKDFQMFYLQVSQFNDAGDREIAEIHQQYHRSFDVKASLVKFLAGFRIKAHRGMTFDFDDLVGKKLNIVVTHTPDPNGVKHANITATSLLTGDNKRTN
jgi:hypothetical protein